MKYGEDDSGALKGSGVERVVLSFCDSAEKPLTEMFMGSSHSSLAAEKISAFVLGLVLVLVL